MKGSDWLDWITENRNATWQRGPWHSTHGMCLVGVQVREQGGYGIVDLATCASDSDGSPDEWSPWLTRNEDHDWERPDSRAPKGCVLIGLEVREQPGFGIVDTRCIFRVKDAEQPGEWITGNREGNILRSVCANGRVITGIQIAEQAGFGIVNLRLRHTDHKKVNETALSQAST